MKRLQPFVRLFIVGVSIALVVAIGWILPSGVSADPSTPTRQPETVSPPAQPAQTNRTIFLPMVRQVAPGTVPTKSSLPQPIVMQQSPAVGEELAPDQPVELVFDRAMDQQSVEQAFQLVEVYDSVTDTSTGLQDATAPAAALTGQFVWTNDHTVIFTPSVTLKRDATYRIVLRDGAKAADGTAMKGRLAYRFTTPGYLNVSQVVPADNAKNIAPDSAITVVFDRPVVPLEMVEQQTNLPDPLTFNPPIAGDGSWVNTSIYMYRPSEPLPHATTYTASVSADLTDATGSPMQQPYQWGFTTDQPPAVEVQHVVPTMGEAFAPVDTSVVIHFSQKVDAASARERFHLTSANGQEIAGTLQMLDATLIYTPSQRLGFHQDYTIALDAGVASAEQGRPMQSAYKSTFTTVPLPKITSVEPTDGSTDVPYYEDVVIHFNGPIDPETVMPAVQITPPISELSHYFSHYNHSFHISFPMLGTTTYTVHIAPDIADRYGNTTGQTMDVSFTTAPLPSSLALRVPRQVATYSAYKPTRVTIESVNVQTATLALYQLPEEALLDSIYSNEGKGTLIRRWDAPLNAPHDAPATTRVALAEDGSALPAGVYMLTLDRGNQYNQTHMLVVSTLNLTLKESDNGALVWANDLKTGEPVSGLTLDFLNKRDDTSVGSATTDQNGIAQLTLDAAANSSSLVAIANQPFAAASSAWYDGVHPSYDFELPYAAEHAQQVGHITTDRTIYRPDQAVFFKGILRQDADVQYSLPPHSTVQVVIESPRYQKVYDKELSLSAYGSFSGQLPLPADAPLGTYRITVRTGIATFSQSFDVAAYRVPEFAVNVAPQQDEAVRGNPIKATVAVSYYFGLPVQHAPVEWTVKLSNYTFSPDWAKRYQFHNQDDMWYCWYCWWMPREEPTVIMEGQGVTDKQGQVHITLPADLRNSAGQPITQSKRLIFEAKATGTDNQVISGRGEMVRHGSDRYVGVATTAYIGKAGEPQQVEVVSADLTGAPAPAQDVLVQVYRQEWVNHYLELESRWSWERKRTLVAQEQTTTNEQGQAQVSFVPVEGGSYQIVANSRDGSGREVTASTFFWVSSSDFVSWRMQNNDRIMLIADKDTYHAGETAEIFIPSPFQVEHWALVTVERGGVLSHEVIRMTGNSTVYRLPITNAHVPNVYVSVVLFSPPHEGNVYLPSMPANYKVGVVPLAVEPDMQTLHIRVEPDQTQAEPGQEVRYTIQVTDKDGNPVVAELSLDLVDKAVLSLMPRVPRAIVETFFGKRPLGVVTASGMSVSADRDLEEEEKDDQVLDDEEPEEPAPEPLAPPATGTPVILGYPDDGDEGREKDDPNAPSVREEFADTAYWEGQIETDNTGHASVDVSLPDNLTTWVMRAVGITKDTKVGESTAEVVANKPLMVRPVAPRFFVVGDKAELAANVSNRTDAPLNVQVGLHASGVTLGSPITQTVQVAAGGEAKVRWDVTVQDVPTVNLVFAAVSGAYSDASKPRLTTAPDGMLPVYRYAAAETVGTAGYLPDRGTRTEVIGLPPLDALDEQQGELTVRLDPSLAAGMRDGLKALEHFPYECTEQVVSRFLPNVVTSKALKELGVDNSDLEEQLPKLVAEGLDKLYDRQHTDGGWGWWDRVYEQSNPYITAYVVFGMVKAKAAGYEVNENMLMGGISYLQWAVQPDGHSIMPWTADRAAWILYVLTEAGEVDTFRIDTIYEQRDNLSLYGKALLAMSIHRVNPQDERIPALMADFNSAAIVSATGTHWEESRRDSWGMNTDTRTTAIILKALTQITPDSQLIPNVVRWLMVARDGDAWETTQETVWSLLALTDWMVQSGELDAAYDYTVWMSQPGVYEKRDMLAEGTMTSDQVNTPVVLTRKVADLLTGGKNWLTVGRSAGAGELYYAAHLRAFLPVEQIKPLDRGIIVRRRYTDAACEEGPACPPVSEVQLGDTIRVELSIVAPHNLTYVMVEDPLPAGAEVIAPSLATTDDATYPGGGRMPAWYPEGYGDWWWWWWRWYEHSEYRDEKVVLFSNHLWRGTYTYTYMMRATLPGEFRVIPTTASEIYFPEVHGRSAGQLLRVQP